MILDRLDMIAEQSEHLVDFVHSDGRLALLNISHEPQPYSRSLRHFRLRQARFSSQALDLSTERRRYTRYGFLFVVLHFGYTIKGITLAVNTILYTRKGS